MAPRATVADVRSLNAFPESDAVSDDKVEGWLEGRASEIDLLFEKRGAVLPIEGPPSLLGIMKLAEMYGAAAMLESAPVMQNPDEMAAGTNLYLDEYKRLIGVLSAFTDRELQQMGVLPPVQASSGSVGQGLSMVENAAISEQPRWYNSPPFRVVSHG